MSSSRMSWGELRASVKKCPHSKCPRNEEKKAILFNRKEDSLSKVKFVVVSQEPGASLRRDCNCNGENDVEKMEKCLAYGCSTSGPKGTSPINRMIKIFGNFDPRKGEVYWTHALKCVPKEDSEIRRDWRVCAPLCKEYFEKELNLISAKEPAIIAMGNYALALCRHVLENQSIFYTGGIMEYIRNSDSKGRSFLFNGREIRLFPLIHPSYRIPILKQYDKNGEVQRKEEASIERLKKEHDRIKI